MVNTVLLFPPHQETTQAASELSQASRTPRQEG